MQQETTITEPIRFAQFDTHKAYNKVNASIVAYKDEKSGGEYTRTGTEYEYTSEPEQIDGFYYMPALPELVEAGLFDGVTVLDGIPIEITQEDFV
jgi:hypothetical protein